MLISFVNKRVYNIYTVYDQLFYTIDIISDPLDLLPDSYPFRFI